MTLHLYDVRVYRQSNCDYGKKTASPPYGLTMGKKTTDMQIYRLVRPVLLFIIYKENFRKNYMPFIRGEFKKKNYSVQK